MRKVAIVSSTALLFYCDEMGQKVTLSYLFLIYLLYLLLFIISTLVNLGLSQLAIQRNRIHNSFRYPNVKRFITGIRVFLVTSIYRIYLRIIDFLFTIPISRSIASSESLVQTNYFKILAIFRAIIHSVTLSYSVRGRYVSLFSHTATAQYLYNCT